MIKKILIDHGHGGLIDGKYQTKGKRAAFDGIELYEGMVNRVQAHLLNYRLSMVGIPSEIIAPENEDISVRARIMRVNKIVAKSPNEYLLIPIHSNGHESEQSHGWEIFTSHGETASDGYATVFEKYFRRLFPRFVVRRGLIGGMKESNFGLLTATRCPAVYIEDLFMTNKAEFLILTDPNAIACLVDYKFQAILEICGKIERETNNRKIEE